MTPVDAPVVLVVDDSEICIEVAKAALEEAGFRVVSATSPFGATGLVRQTGAACVVVDVSMPALDGNKLVEIFRRNLGPTVPILLHSDRPITQLRALALACGASGAVPKTSDGAALVAAVRRHLSRIAESAPR